MQSCTKCRIMIRGYKKCCPLCGGQLQGDPEKPAFPAIEDKKVSKVTLVKIAGFALILFLASMLVVQVILGRMLSWMPLAAVICGIAFADVWAANILVRNVLKMITYQICVGMVLCVIIDAYFGWIGWSAAYVLPAATLALVGITFLVNLIGRVELMDFVMYLVFDLAVSWLQVIFLIIRKNPHPLPAVISILVNTLVFLAILIFFRKDLFSATRRYFNT